MSERLADTWRPAPLTSEQTALWALKAQDRSQRLLQLAGDVADPADVQSMRVDEPADWPFGNFMLAWLDASGSPRLVRHLPDAEFFLRLVGVAFAPVFDRRPDLAELLADASRPEMSITNDVLQIQLRGREEGYSMIRHHALMLFTAALWLDEPRRTGWLDLYDEIVDYVDARPEGRPTLEQLAAVEADAFRDFVSLAPQTLEAAAADALLSDTDALANILAYQLYAAAAIGLVWRQYRDVSPDERDDWFHGQLSDLYRRPDYLEENWMAHP